MKKPITLFLLLSIHLIGHSQGMTIIDQDFSKAKAIADQENKLLFIDFYTTWCGPCKKLDKLVFQNDSVSTILGRDFILLRYDAEKDKEFHLSKKHHISSYPTAIVLNREGYVVKRKYGFSSENTKELLSKVFDFTSRSLELNQQNFYIKGYSNSIQEERYPKFYIDFVNRDDIKVTTRKEFKEYWENTNDLFDEAYFSTLVYFADDAPVHLANQFLDNKEKYIELYGETDVDVALFKFSFGQFDHAVDTKSKLDLEKAKAFSIKAIGEESTENLLSFYKGKFEEANNNK
ncbi:MAG: thioredoxin family protein [Bacteroidota bacterium]